MGVALCCRAQAEAAGSILMGTIKTMNLPVTSDLSQAALEDAVSVMGQLSPWSYLVCAASNVPSGREASKEFNGIVIVEAPDGLFADADHWILISPNGAVWSGKM